MKSGSAAGDAGRTVLVRSGEASGERVRLSVYDLVNGTFGSTRTFYYRQRLDTEALRESLRRTLVHYPLLTGRLVRDADRGLSVVCDDAGRRVRRDQLRPAHARLRPRPPRRATTCAATSTPSTPSGSSDTTPRC